MPKNITQYDLLISCPSDIKGEIEIIHKVIERFNTQFSDTLKISINPKHWSKNSYTESGGKPQNLLNKQFIDECDAAVAIFWTKFGSPTENYDSGTEEEIEKMLESGKQVFMYFSNKPIPPSDINSENHKKVNDFKERYKDRGIYYVFNSDTDFEEKFYAHITQHFLLLGKAEELSTMNKPKLIIKSISNNELTSNLIAHNFSVKNHLTKEEMISSIIDLYNKISEYKLYKAVDVLTNSIDVSPNSIFDMTLLNQRKVTIDKDKQKLLSEVAEELEVNITDNFFDLGNLYEDMFGRLLLDKNIIGSNDENLKYYDIMELYKLINNVYKWAEFEKKYYNLKCIKLVLVNEGTAVDEDIDVELYFSKEMLIYHKDLPLLDEFTAHHITNELSIYDIFGINKTNLYLDFDSSKKQVFNTNIPTPPVDYLLYRGKSYQEEFMDSIDDVFEYDFYEEGDKIIVQLHIDYIKHNTAVAFPSVLFVAENTADIKYKIISKFNDKAIENILKFD